MPNEGWQEHDTPLLNEAQKAVGFVPDITFELITHRFPAGPHPLLDIAQAN